MGDQGGAAGITPRPASVTKDASPAVLLPSHDPRYLGRDLVFAGNERHLAVLVESLRRRSARYWNLWRKEHPRIVPDLRGVVLSGRALRGLDLRRTRLDGAILRRVDLAGAQLERASLTGAKLDRADLSWARAECVDLSAASLRGATLRHGKFARAACLGGTDLEHADLHGADFSGARMHAVQLTGADLTEAVFDGTDLSEADLSQAILSDTSLLGASLRGASVGGTFIRRIHTNAKTDQHGLSVDVHVVWDRPRGSVVEFTEANDIRVAQFHEVLEEHGAVGKLLASTTRRVVLILGRFTPRRKRVLDRLATALRERGKIAVIFDFPRPEDREISDTVRFIAGMAQFVVVDITHASSVPLELQATIPDLMVPVLPIVEAGRPIFAMFSDLQRRYAWIQPPVSYRSADELVRHVDTAILARADAAAESIRRVRGDSVLAPIGVARVARVSRKVPRKKTGA
jgi:uncharacterized protein YjbI with pentapeptide repeats